MNIPFQAGISLVLRLHATLAHLAERHIRNVQVPGSNPGGGSRKKGLNVAMSKEKDPPKIWVDYNRRSWALKRLDLACAICVPFQAYANPN